MLFVMLIVSVLIVVLLMQNYYEAPKISTWAQFSDKLLWET